MTDEQLAREVKDELFWDPKIDSGAIAVAVDGGGVTLRGTVGSLREKVEAKKAAERVRGVTAVKNKLDVRLLTEDRREDADLRGDVLQALMLDTLVPLTRESPTSPTTSVSKTPRTSPTTSTTRSGGRSCATRGSTRSASR